VINELTALMVTNAATDDDLPTNSVQYSLAAAPEGALISDLGVITWTPTEADGPSSNVFVTIATDDGTPPRSASNVFSVVVNEVNIAPLLTVPAAQALDELTTLVVTNLASDEDIPTNLLRFALVSAPDGMVIVPGSGIITWMPTRAQGPSTNTITVSLTDNGIPILSVTQSFQVIVRDVNAPPSVSLLAPTNNAVFAPFEAIRIHALASDPDENLARVDFLSDSNAIGAAFSAPFEMTWTNGRPGWHVITARALDIGGLSATSTPVTIQIPPMWMRAQALTYGLLRLTLIGEAGSNYVIQASSNLVRWLPLETNRAGADGLFDWTNSPAAAARKEYYRVSD
jgi:large repetitive protein